MSNNEPVPPSPTVGFMLPLPLQHATPLDASSFVSLIHSSSSSSSQQPKRFSKATPRKSLSVGRLDLTPNQLPLLILDVRPTGSYRRWHLAHPSSHNVLVPLQFIKRFQRGALQSVDLEALLPSSEAQEIYRNRWVNGCKVVVVDENMEETAPQVNTGGISTVSAALRRLQLEPSSSFTLTGPATAHLEEERGSMSDGENHSTAHNSKLQKRTSGKSPQSIDALHHNHEAKKFDFGNHLPLFPPAAASNSMPSSESPDGPNSLSLHLQPSPSRPGRSVRLRPSNLSLGISVHSGGHLQEKENHVNESHSILSSVNSMMGETHLSGATDLETHAHFDSDGMEEDYSTSRNSPTKNGLLNLPAGALKLLQRRSNNAGGNNNSGAHTTGDSDESVSPKSLSNRMRHSSAWILLALLEREWAVPEAVTSNCVSTSIHWLAGGLSSLRQTHPDLFVASPEPMSHLSTPCSPLPSSRPALSLVISRPTLVASMASAPPTTMNPSAPYSKVVDGLFMGSEPHSLRALVEATGAGAILNMARECPDRSHEFEGPYMRIPVDDDAEPENTEQELHRGIAFIEKCRREGYTVFVHCRAGVSRSATVVIGYLMRWRGQSMREAYEGLKQARPEICPNLGFVSLLVKMERDVEARKREGGK